MNAECAHNFDALGYPTAPIWLEIIPCFLLIYSVALHSDRKLLNLNSI